MVYDWVISSVYGGALKEHRFRNYISIDETTGASNTEETQADTDLFYAGPRKSDEDCGADKNIEKTCGVKINLKTILTCYTSKTYSRVNTLKNHLKPGDIGYCELKW